MGIYVLSSDTWKVFTLIVQGRGGGELTKIMAVVGVDVRIGNAFLLWMGGSSGK